MLSSKEIIRLIEADGWVHVSTEGSHRHYKHHTKLGKVTIPHPKKDFGIKTIRSIEKQSGLKLK